MKIIEAHHISGYLLQIVFDNGKKVYADFTDFITKSLQPMTNQFKEINRFKNVSVDNGHLTWENGQMDISAQSILKGKYNPPTNKISK